MIGDIDFIVQHKDEQKVEKVLEENNYCNIADYSTLFRIFKPTHLARRVNKNKTIAIEPHLELLESRRQVIFNSKELISDFKDRD